MPTTIVTQIKSTIFRPWENDGNGTVNVNFTFWKLETSSAINMTAQTAMKTYSNEALDLAMKQAASQYLGEPVDTRIEIS